MTDQNKHDPELKLLGETLRNALPPIGDAEPPHDLWPRLLQRIEGQPGRSAHSPRLRWFTGVPWFDWALLGVAAVAMLLFPALIPALLYHL
jgi:hypothetical protein